MLDEIKQRCLHGPEKFDDVCFDVYYRDDPIVKVVDRGILENTAAYVWFKTGAAWRVLAINIAEGIINNYVWFICIWLVLFIIYLGK